MPITIGSNISSLRTQRSLTDSSAELARAFERLASGQRINRAADDAAGLSIADALRADTRVFAQAYRNLNDGISVLGIADGAVEQLTGITIRIRELATQSANGSFSAAQRRAIDKEAQALSREYSRIIQTTKFNGVALLNGSLNRLALQAGYGSEATLSVSVGGSTGNGTFRAATSYAAEPLNTFNVKLGDLNGDGIIDLVTSGTTGGVDSATVRLGTESGAFGSAANYSIGVTSGMRLADVNNDGVLDIVGAEATDVGFMIGNGDGTFKAATIYSMTSANDVEVADLNGDGVNDLISGGGGVNPFVSVRLGAGDGTFGALTTFNYAPGATFGEIAAADFNRDGVTDLVAATQGGGPVHVLLGNGNGSFRLGGFATSTPGVSGVDVGDLNGDGILDIGLQAFAGLGLTYITLGNGDGTFRLSQQPGDLSMSSSGGVVFADTNGDGNLDLVFNGSSGGAGYMYVMSGNGNGTFRASTSYAMESSASVALDSGDVNGDGVVDIVTAGSGAGGRATVRLGTAVSGTAPLLEFSLRTLADARQSMGLLDDALERLAGQRATIGASMSRITVAAANLLTGAEAFSAAESRIRDSDIAAEAASLIRSQILQQTAAAILAQANQQPSLVLRLLDGDSRR